MTFKGSVIWLRLGPLWPGTVNRLRCGPGRVSHLAESCNCGLSRDPSLTGSLRSVSSGWGGSAVWSCAWLRTDGNKPQDWLPQACQGTGGDAWGRHFAFV